MHSIATLLLAFNFLLLLITFFNLMTIRVVKPKNTGEINESVSVLLPLRNEAQNVPGLLDSVINQADLLNWEILALNDNSTDDTLSLILDTSASNLKVLRGSELPSNWLGKNFACHQLATASSGDYLVFVDADVRLTKTAISDAIHEMRRLNWDFISPYPRQLAFSFIERLAQPLLQWSWFATLPLRISEKLRRPSMAVANGQFFIVKRAAYFAAGGHEIIKSEVLDDLELARKLIQSSAKGGVADGSKVAQCRMYSSSSELIEGYSKSQWRAFKNPVGAILVSLVLFFSSILPIILGISGEIIGWYGYFVLVLSRVLVAAKTNSVLSSASLHPLSAALWIYLIGHSWVRRYRGELTWRGRKL